ncbi:AMP-binding protein [Sphingomonas sp. GC_Shp_3]|uniref:AMP-binding protein n=1 Tax=Sphingomonas sp. GC_Shp_3 TaxID=2937383 RepID=UPI00226AB0C7|nr:AMP-binding protein [Sphingomonas sp. GC_Shp_3]
MSSALPRSAIQRIARAVVMAEVGRLRERGQPGLPADIWPDAMPIGDDGLGLDSLEQLGALGALAEMFGLDDHLLGPEPPRVVGGWVGWIMARHDPGDGELTVMTSGSTGQPRPCVHAIADLLTEARFLATQLGGRRRVVALVPGHHLYGIIWTALLPTVLNVPVVARTLGAPLDLASGDLVVAVPDQWRAIARLVRSFPEDVVGCSSAGPLDATLATDLLAAGLSRLLDVYGSSETGGIAVRDLPDDAYNLLPRWRLAPAGEDDWQLYDARGRSYSLPDHVERIGERRLRPIRRRDGAVKVGGETVWPARVVDTLRQIDGVADVAVRQHDNGRLKAFIVPDGTREPTELSAAIENICDVRLSPAERPRSVRFGAALPRNMMGKLEDWA